jgi:GTPase SAR1 family protein
MNQKIVIAGMPGSGKSTFIAALRHLLVSHDVPTRLSATKLSDTEKHLNRLEEEWIACKKVERTKQVVEEWVSFFVRSEGSSAEAQILVPDFSGEAFRRPAATGMCSSAIASMLREIDGILLFTNADRGADDIRLEALGDLLEDDTTAQNESTPEQDEAHKDREVLDTPGEQDGNAQDESLPFNPINMPEEPLLVELLQILNRPPRVARQRMIAVIVSAWDEVTDSSLSPDTWLKLNRPMLWQYFQANRDVWRHRVYGVSAQGGRLPDEKDALQSKIPGERVQIVGNGASPHDLTAPVDWLMAPER